MMTVRSGVFETNSSMTHSLVICKYSDYEDWTKGKLLFNPREEQPFVKVEEGRKRNTKQLREEYLKDSWLAQRYGCINDHNINKYARGKVGLDYFEFPDDIIYFYMTYQEFKDWVSNRCFELIATGGNVDGVKVIALGYHGYDG